MTSAITPSEHGGPLIVIGAGQASVSLVAQCRTGGFEGPITIIGDEPILPYQRPPLSKRYLLGQLDKDALLLRPAEFFERNHVEMLLGRRVVSVDRVAKQIVLDDGRTLPYGRLVFATGSRPRQLPAAMGGALRGNLYLRGIADADAMAEAFLPDRHLLVIGGGYIGLEAAAVARSLGMRVTLLEAAPRILQRVASEHTSDYFRKHHADHGVEIREGVGLERLRAGADGHVDAAMLSNGEVLPIDVALTGIGAVPNVELAAESGITVENGIVVDDHGATSDPSIFATGDCANLPFEGGRARFESVPAAIAHAQHVAHCLVGEGKVFKTVPWFWSDQYEVKLQIAGLSSGYDSAVLRRGATPEIMSVWYYRHGRFIAVDAMNKSIAFVVGRKWLEAGFSPKPADIEDPATNLRKLATG